MFIEMDRRAIFAKPVVIRTEGSNKGKWEIIGRAGLDYIKMATDTPMNLVFTFCHEFGHIKGDKVFFARKPFLGLGKLPVMTFDEIKATNASIELTEEEQKTLPRLMDSRRIVKPSWDQLWVADKLLRVLFRGQVDFSKIKVYSYTKKEMRREVAENPSASMKKKGTKIINLNTKNERNVELPAIFTEAACLLILENTYKRYGFWGDRDREFIVPKNSLGHQRAQNIVAKAYAGKGWRIPSMKDLNG